ncbi:caspase family protein [Rhizobium sp. BR 249]|uniref:caspase family protein n=1 Tax=Rhizobium sp. BR 249 TaxID=3040011 RepID=UPI0039BF3D42
MKRAVVIGIDDYGEAQDNLEGCVADAMAVADKLATHGNGDPNFDVITLTSDTEKVTTEAMDEGLRILFKGKADVVVFYFAGHGLLDAETNRGYLVSQDFTKAVPGISLADIINMANAAHSEISSTVIILDSCHSGFVGELPALGNSSISVIGKGVTILAAADRNQAAAEHDGHGLFTGILLDGLNGSASDVLGRITPPSLYSLVDQTLGGFEQRPVYKANVQQFITLREVAPKVPRIQLRKLKDYFPTPGYILKVDPSFESGRGEFTEEYKDMPVIPENEAIFRDLQTYYKVNLVAPVDQPFPWHAAMYSTGFRLTSQGAHYRRLAEKKRF